MSQTVIGFFDDASEARRAVEELRSSGFSNDRVDISSGQTGTTSNTSGKPDTDDPNTVRSTPDGRTVDKEGRNTNRFTDFFNSLFGGSDDDDAKRFSHVASRSNSIVTVHAQSKDDAERAADILDNCGAVDVDEKATSYGYTSGTSSKKRTDLESGTRGNSGTRSRIINRPISDDIRLREDPDMRTED